MGGRMSAEQRRRWKQNNIAKGLCIYCTRPHMEGRSVCKSHYEAGREYKRNWQRRNRALRSGAREEAAVSVVRDRPLWWMLFDYENAVTVWDLAEVRQ